MYDDGAQQNSIKKDCSLLKRFFGNAFSRESNFDSLFMLLVVAMKF